MPANYIISPTGVRIPKDKRANLLWRRKILRKCRADAAFAEDMWVLASRDILFWMNAFVWTFDPRLRPDPTRQPFITYDFQDKAITEMMESLGVEDSLIEKSRDMGATWIVEMVFLHQWLFVPYLTFLLASRKEDLVDKADDPDAMMWKLDFALKNLPGWMVPTFTRMKLHLKNEDNGSTIDGTSTTGDSARGGRRTAIMLDEFASVPEGYAVESSTADVTDCRFFNSTPKGTGNAFYARRQKGDCKIFRFHWSEHPRKNIGLYSSTKNEGGSHDLEILDQDYEFPEDYEFVLDGKLRSVWYDRECRRRASAQEIAQELDIDYLASGSPFFDIGTIEKLRGEARDPLIRGELVFDSETGEPGEFERNPDGRLSLWCFLTPQDTPLGDRDYAMGVDVSAGSDKSNSVVSILDTRTNEKVAEFVTIRVMPHELAYYAYSLAKWFGGAQNKCKIAWEDNGPGQIFGKVIIELGYRNVYYRRDEKSLRKTQSDKPGWFSSRQNKILLLGDYRRALAKETFVNRSLAALDECLEYQYTPDGGVNHVKELDSTDPSGARDNHGDRVIADALALVVSRGLNSREKPKPPTPVASFMGRRARRRAAALVKGRW